MRAAVLLLCWPSLALADQKLPPRTLVVDDVEAAADVSNIIFLNRCVGGCTLNHSSGVSDARTNTSSIPNGAGPSVVSEWAHGDDAWADLVACVRDVYAPYDVNVTDVDPGESTVHHEAIVAGTGDQIGWSNAGGVGTVAGDCSPYDNGISFVFANQTSDIEYLCYAVAQETAHTYGLHHAYLCSDPLTYLDGCGRKYFRNFNAQCGEFAPEQCPCSALQNSHVRLLDTFGPSPTPLPAPTVEVLSPTPDTTVGPGFSVFVTAEITRGVSVAELWINGYRWASVEDNEFENQGGTYELRTPTDLPDGVLDLEVRVYNDLRTAYGSATQTVTKGAPCTSAEACAEGQACEAGRCFWAPPTGELGDACTYPQACVSGECRADGASEICTEPCFTGTAAVCPDPYTCIAEDGQTSGFCLTPTEAGTCCQAGPHGAGNAALLVALVGLALVRPRRRSRWETDRR